MWILNPSFVSFADDTSTIITPVNASYVEGKVEIIIIKKEPEGSFFYNNSMIKVLSGGFNWKN